MRSALRDIWNGTAKISGERIYGCLYRLILKNQAKTLYELVRRFLQDKAGRLMSEGIVNRPELNAYMQARSIRTGSDHERQAAELVLLNLEQSWIQFGRRLCMFVNPLKYLVS
jgi:hypothetical protein